MTTAMPTYYLATLDAKYELSACATTPKEAVRLLHKAWVAWWKDDTYGGDSSTWKEHLEGGDITMRALSPGITYCDGEGPVDLAVPYDKRAAWVWSACDASGLSDARYRSRKIR